MKNRLMTGLKWTVIVLMAGLAVYELLGLAVVDFMTLNPAPEGLPIVWLLAIAQLVAVCLAFRIRWLPLVAGVANWIGVLAVFQFGEQHLAVGAALKNTSPLFVFIFFAALFLAIPSTEARPKARPCP